MKKLSPIGAFLMGAACVANAQSPAGTPIVFSNILDNSVFVGKACTNYNQAFFNAVTGDIIRCTNATSFFVSISGIWTTVSGGGGGGSPLWGGIGGTLSNQGDLQAALNLKQNALTFPLAIASGGNGTATPAIVAGANVTVSGTWPNYTISSSGGGGGGSVAWGSITGTLSSQGDLQTALNAKQNTLTLPLSIANGGTGTATPVITAGSNVSITGTWPNYTIAATGGGGGGGVPSGSALPATCTPGTDTLFFKTNGTPNQMIYTCSAINTWTLNELLGGSGGLAINGTTGALDIVTSVVPRVAAANAFTGRNSFTISDYVQQATPAAPAAGKLSLYANNDGSLHYINSAGTDAALATGAGFANPMTTEDDVIVGGASGAPARLAKGADSQVLGVDPSTHHLAYLTQSGAGGTPGGTDRELQVNHSGAFAGVSIDHYWDLGTFLTNDRFAVRAEPLGALLPAGATEPDATWAMTGATDGHPQISISNWEPTDYSQMYFWSATTDNLGHYSHRYQFGVGNGGETGLGVANKMFVYDAGACTGAPASCSGGKGMLAIFDATTTTPTTSFQGALRIMPQSTDPVCSATGDIGKQWMDNTDATTSHFKVCAAVASTPTWVTVF